MFTPIIAVFSGGTSSEREVSLGSGRASALALARSFDTQIFELKADALPLGLDPRRHVVFSTLHGGFGEDGSMQRLLDAAGVAYAGCDAASSALTMDKTRTKEAAASRGVQVGLGVVFTVSASSLAPTADAFVTQLGEQVVLKPNDQGSSVGLTINTGRAELAASLSQLTPGSWLAEQRLVGRELSVGVLRGAAMGVVEIRPKSGVYDYASKYTKGATEYFAPAPLAESAFAACGCRDYARVDFILVGVGALYLLEINTLPGMKEMSLLPMSARCVGLDFTALARELVMPALGRFSATTSS
jgi:D-alanine-D-alanine ligase